MWRPRAPVPLPQSGGAFMWTAESEVAPPGSYHYALNLLPASSQRDGAPMVPRGPFRVVSTGTAAGNAVVAHGQLFKADGTAVTWLLSSSSGLWSFAWEGGPFTNVVTSANFASAGVSLVAATHYWCVYNNRIAFNPSDGAQKPWTWDGSSGASGVVELNNAPLAYGRPTVRSAKLFFIEYSARDTIAWSEENDATIGYATAPYTNEWKLSQTGTAPLYAIKGTNDGLYYFREKSVGVIRGDAGPDFVTASTHDAVSPSIGTLSPNGVEAAGDEIWFVDQWGLPNVIPNGGSPIKIWDEMGANVTGTVEPFGFDDVGWDRSAVPGVTSTVEVLAVPPQQLIPYETIWFNVPSSATAGRAFLVCDREKRKAVSWFVPYVGAAVKPTASLIQDSVNSFTAPTLVDASTGRFLRYVDAGGATGSDGDASGNAVATTWRLIGAPLGVNPVVELHYESLAVVARKGSNVTLNAQVLTSRLRTSGTVSAAQALTPGTTFARAMVGLNQGGRWGRPVFTGTATSGSNATLAIQSWCLNAFPVATGPTVP